MLCSSFAKCEVQMVIIFFASEGCSSGATSILHTAGGNKWTPNMALMTAVEVMPNEVSYQRKRTQTH